MSYTHQISLILPAAQREAGNRIAEAMGWGPENYSVRVFTNDALTHYGLSAPCDEEFLSQMNNAGNGVSPEGCDPADIAAVMPVLISDVQLIGSMRPEDQFDALCERHGLTRGVAPEA